MTDFNAVERWCQSYLELQYSRDIGIQFGRLLNALGEIASAPKDGVDRFDWLKQQEEQVTRALESLVDAFQSHLEAQKQHLRAVAQPVTNSHLTRLFVYGTLKRGQRRSGALSQQRFIGVARTLPVYRMFDCGGYPGLVGDESGHSIEGELWEVDADCLAKLDEIEGVDLKLYQRGPVQLAEPYHNEAAQSYFYCRSVSGLNDCGNSWPAPH